MACYLSRQTYLMRHESATCNIFCSDDWHYITDLSGDGLDPSWLLRISITEPSTYDEDVVKLVLSSELDEHTQYVALSHCWGSPEFLLPRTLECNIIAHVEEVFDTVSRRGRFAMPSTLKKVWGTIFFGLTRFASSRTLPMTGNMKHVAWLSSMTILFSQSQLWMQRIALKVCFRRT